METLSVDCRAVTGGWDCHVTVGSDAGPTSHRVQVRDEVLHRLRPGDDSPDDLVRDSFEFLLQREARESILGSFDLNVIERYFPGWERAMRRPDDAG